MARRCENCTHDKVCNEWAVSSGLPFVNANTCEHFKDTADVVPRSELAIETFQLAAEIDGLKDKYNKLMFENIKLQALIENIPKLSEAALKGFASEVLSDLKKQVHDKATYPHNSGIDPYMSLKVFDAILNNIIKKYSEGKNE